MPIILVADDNPLTLRFFVDALAQLGIESTTAMDGEEAFALARHTKFDLLLLDANMPRLDGIGALQRLRITADAASHTAIALATTAATDAETRQRLMGADFADLIVKPVLLSDLRQVIAPYLSNLADAMPPSVVATPMTKIALTLDDAQALAAVGGSTEIMTALRGLLCEELKQLPSELASFAQTQNFDALHDRLHRLDASAGFCGTPGIASAIADVRKTINSVQWPEHELSDLCNTCSATLQMLTG